MTQSTKVNSRLLIFHLPIVFIGGVSKVANPVSVITALDRLQQSVSEIIIVHCSVEEIDEWNPENNVGYGQPVVIPEETKSTMEFELF